MSQGPFHENRLIASGPTRAQIAAGEGRAAKLFIKAEAKPTPASPHPVFIELQLGRSQDKPSSRQCWVHINFDGYMWRAPPPTSATSRISPPPETRRWPPLVG